MMKLSEKEKELLDALPISGRWVTSTELVEAVFGKEPPFNARGLLRSRLNSLAAKLERMGGKGPRVAKSARRGPYPTEYRRAQA